MYFPGCFATIFSAIIGHQCFPVGCMMIFDTPGKGFVASQGKGVEKAVVVGNWSRELFEL